MQERTQNQVTAEMMLLNRLKKKQQTRPDSPPNPRQAQKTHRSFWRNFGLFIIVAMGTLTITSAFEVAAENRKLKSRLAELEAMLPQSEQRSVNLYEPLPDLYFNYDSYRDWKVIPTINDREESSWAMSPKI